MSYKKLFLVSSLSLMTLSACSGFNPFGQSVKIDEAKFWQRNNASSALYLQGPKAQQMLHQNISRCVSEISELNRLGEIRRAVPANYNSGNEIDARTASQKVLDGYDTPARDGFLYSEHLDYHDFETCMEAKGWERVEHLPYDSADLARQDYLERYGNKKKKTTLGDRENVTTLHGTSKDFSTQKGVNE